MASPLLTRWLCIFLLLKSFRDSLNKWNVGIENFRSNHCYIRQWRIWSEYSICSSRWTKLLWCSIWLLECILPAECIVSWMSRLHKERNCIRKVSLWLNGYIMLIYCVYAVYKKYAFLFVWIIQWVYQTILIFISNYIANKKNMD